MAIYRKLVFSIAVLAMLNLSLFAQDKGDEDKEMRNLTSQDRDKEAIKEAQSGWWKTSMLGKEERVKWWRDARFGMFIHWGIYSEAGGEWKGKEVGGYAEHLMRKEKISKHEYLQLANKFNPQKFDAEKWVLSAKNAGMHYFVVTAKHHDGFAMYPSSVSDFDIYDKTPFKRDPMEELAKACRKYGLKFGFYYSHAFDWEHPDAPGNDWEFNNPGGDKNLFGGRNWFDSHPELIAKAKKYVDEKSIPQIKELIQKYHPDMLWFDTPHKLPFSENLRILKAIRETDPEIVINGRLARNADGNFGDYLNTADRPAEFFPVIGDWEAIPTTNESYGYSKYDNSHKSASHFIKLLANGVARGGNILLNIGPKGDGAFDTKDQKILDSISVWMKKYESSINKATASPLSIQSWGVVTKKEHTLFLHVFDWPKSNKLLVGGFKNKVSKVYSLSDSSKKELKAKLENGNFIIYLPAKPIDKVNSVLALDIIEPLEIDSIRYIDTQALTRLLAFDAKLGGKGLGFGDGKTNKFYVHGWNSLAQNMSWTFKSIKEGKFKVVLKYIAEKENSGEINVSIGNLNINKQINSSMISSELTTVELGEVKLKKGLHNLDVKPVNITGQELIRILEIQLIPIK